MKTESTTQTSLTQSITSQQAGMEQDSIQGVFHSVKSSLSSEATTPSLDTDITARQVSPASKQEEASTTSWANWIWQLLTEFKKNSVDCELETLGHPNGILGLLMTNKTEDTKKMASKRLDALQTAVETDSKNWWVWSKSTAVNTLSSLRELLDNDQLDQFMSQLAQFEKQYEYGQFQDVLNALYTGNELVASIDPMTPVSASDLNEMRQYGKSDEPAQGTDVAFDLLVKGSLPKLSFLTTPSSALTELTHQRPEVAKELLIDLLAGRTRQLKSTGQIEQITQASRELTQVWLMKPEQVAAFVAQLNDSTLVEELKASATNLCVEAHYHAITRTQTAQLDTKALSDLECQVSDFLKVAPSLLKKTDNGEDYAEELELYSRAIKLTRILQADQNKKLEDRVYMLQVPSLKRLVSQLGDSANSSEKALYLAAENYRQHMTAYSIRPGYKILNAFQQARFDFRLAQEDALLTEAKAHLSTNNAETVISTGSYEGNRELLLKMDQVMQRTTPVRPVDSKTEAFFQLGAKRVWKNRASVQERLADLQHQKDLIDCGYDFTSQLMEFGRNNYDAAYTSLNVVQQLTKAIIKTPQTLSSICKGEVSILALLCNGKDAVKSLEQKARAVLESTLAVAERDPRLFRRMAGDCAQSTQQLLAVFGVTNAGLINNLQTRLQAEAMASVFAGDTPVFEDLKPEDIEAMKTFQMFCDLGDLAFKATAAVSAAGQLTSNTLASRTGYVLGGVTGGVIGGVAGAGGIFAGAATGAQIGNYAGAAVGAAIHAGSAVATREVVNHMDGKTLRAVNKLVNYGPMAPFATPAWEQLAQFSRNVAKKQSLLQAISSSVFAPELFRLNRLKAAILGVTNREAGAGWSLAKEGAKTALLIGATAASAMVVSGVLFHGGIISIAMSPFLGSALGGLAISLVMGHGFCRLANNIEYGVEGIAAVMKEIQQAVMPVGSKERKEVESQCRAEAEKMTNALIVQGPYRKLLSEEASIEVSKNFWKNWTQSEDQDLVNEVNGDLANRLAASREKIALDAEELSKIAQAKALILANQDKVEMLRQDANQLAAFRDQLKTLGIDCPANRETLEYFMRDKMLELNYAMLSIAGTDELSENINSIQKVLIERTLNVLKGDYLKNLLELDDKVLVDIKISRSKLNLPTRAELAKTVKESDNCWHKQLVERSAKSKQESLELMLGGVSRTVWAGKKEGNLGQVSEAQLIMAFNQEKIKVQDMQQTRRDFHQAEWNKIGMNVAAAA